MHALSFDPESPFWDEFIDQHWERSPVVVEVHDKHPALELATLFHAVTNMPEWQVSDRFWLARQAQPRSRADFVKLDLDLMGPQPSDSGFDGFFDRMDGHSYGINIHRLAKGRPEYRDLVRVFATALRRCDNPKVEAWESDTFFGNYRATPFGIHRDPASVFSFALAGRRTYYTWPMNHFEPDDPDLGRVDAAVLERHLTHAERFEVSAGQAFYWPSNRWHVVASEGEPFVVAQVSAYFNPDDVSQGG